MLKELFSLKRQYLNHFFDALDLKAAENFLRTLQNCKGLIVLTGVGKSGLVAKKIAVTMTSTGTRAVYLSPTNALHGDLGIVTDKDIFVILSKSGESEEILNLIPYLRGKGVSILSIVSNANSRLAKASDLYINLPLEKELCPFNMAPTTSTSIQLIFGDVMAIALMKEQKFSIDAYALNHPAGSIGKRITLKVKDLMLTGTKIPLCSPDDKLVEILVELSNKRCGCILIVNKEHVLQGIFTDGDLRRALLNHGPQVLDKQIKELMIKTPKNIAANKLALDAMQQMEADPKNAITCLPVLDETKKVLGLIRLHDIVQSGI